MGADGGWSCGCVSAVDAGELTRGRRERAARELLALQASDWAFLDRRRQAGDYPYQRSTATRGRCWMLHATRAAGSPPAKPGARPEPRPCSSPEHARGPVPPVALAAPWPPQPVDSRAPVPSILILSWEYPPLIEGGLARHVRKLSEALVELGAEVHVLTRGGEESPAEEVVAGVSIHRVREPGRPTDLGEFVAWVERMNADMLAAGVELGRPPRLRPRARARLARRHGLRPPRAPVRRPARDDDPRHRARAPPGLGGQAPAVPHPRHRAVGDQPRRPRDRLLVLHARADRRHLRRRRRADRRDPQRHRPG